MNSCNLASLANYSTGYSFGLDKNSSSRNSLNQENDFCSEHCSTNQSIH